MWPFLLLAILILMYLLYRGGRLPVDRESTTAQEALRLAYARGELSDEEFEERRDRLQRET